MIYATFFKLVLKVVLGVIPAAVSAHGVHIWPIAEQYLLVIFQVVAEYFLALNRHRSIRKHHRGLALKRLLDLLCRLLPSFLVDCRPKRRL